MIRIGCLGCVLVWSLGSLAGCGKSPPTPDTGTNSPKTTTNVTEGASAAVAGTTYFSPENAMIQFVFEYTGARDSDAQDAGARDAGEREDDAREGEMIAGGFQAIGGKLEFDVQTGELNYLMLDVESSSVYTTKAELTPRMQSPEYFDVLEHPKLRFESNVIREVASPDRWEAVGNLTILGQQHEVTIPLTISGKGESLRVIAAIHLDRQQIGMTRMQESLNRELVIRFETGPKTTIEEIEQTQ